MKKLTAVEFLENVTKAMVSNGGDLGEDYPALIKHFEQANKLFKEQIIEALHYFGIENAKDYYDATFNQPQS